MNTPEASAARAALRARCAEEGIEVMADIFDIVLDREQVSVYDLASWVEQYGGAQIVYEDYIVRGINAIEDMVMS